MDRSENLLQIDRSRKYCEKAIQILTRNAETQALGFGSAINTIDILFRIHNFIAKYRYKGFCDSLDYANFLVTFATLRVRYEPAINHSAQERRYYTLSLWHAADDSLNTAF